MKFVRSLATLPDRYFFATTVLFSVVLRLPFLRTFDIVSYDGTYYINLARAVTRVGGVAGPFPLGYPLHIVPFMPFMDDVRAAQLVSFLAAMGALIVLFYLCKQWMARPLAMAAVCVLAVNPLFIHYSMTTMSESVYLLWLLLGFLFFARGRLAFAGAAMGVATITRPEALPLFLILVLARRRAGRSLLMMVAAFAAIYAINAIAFSVSSGKVVLLQKANNFALGAKNWQQMEGFFGREEIREGIEQQSALVYYVKRLPLDVWLLVRHSALVLLPLAVLGFVRRRLLIAVAIIPFIVFPLFTPRSEARFVLPYVPFIVIFAMLGIASLRGKRQRVAGAAVAAAVVAAFVINADILTTPVNAEFAPSRSAARWLSTHISPQSKVADRKPFVAFYADAMFEKIPAAPYNETINHLVDRNVRILSLHHPTTSILRPALRGLLYNPAVINGEMRFRQLYYQNTGEVLYESTGEPDPLTRNFVTGLDEQIPMMPTWSPDGTLIAYRTRTGDGVGEIRVLAAPGGGSTVVHRGQAPQDPITWSPDSRRIAFSESVGGRNSLQILDLATGQLEVLTDAGGDDVSPSWSPKGDEIVFSSNRVSSGKNDIYAIHIASRTMSRVTATGDNRYPAVSPNNERIAWVRDGGLIIADRRSGETIRAVVPRDPTNRPTWSPDGRFIAIQGKMWGGGNIFLVRADGGVALLLTKEVEGQAMPDWSPDGRRLVVVSRQKDRVVLCFLAGLEPYYERLTDPPKVYTFRP